MVAYLSAEKTPRPRLIDSPGGGGSGAAFLEPDFHGAGSLVLGGKEEIAVAWKQGEKEPRRTLPAGDYLVRSTTLVREHEGQSWTLCSSMVPGKEMPLAAGATVKAAIDDRLQFSGQADFGRRRLDLGFSLKGIDGRGITLFRGAERPQVTWKAYGKEGNTIAEGALAWG